jgi:phage tail sheath protein FI
MTLDSRAANVQAYALGASGTGSYQSPGANGDNGGVPGPDDYNAIYSTVTSEVDIFNLLVLPRGAGQDDAARRALWGPASAFCQRERAFLIVDAPSDWATVDDAAAGIPNMRLGAVTDHAGIYWPGLRVASRTQPIDPGGTIAGIMARTDTRRGVWKAPAGLEASILGISGLQHRVSDAENGVTNPQAVNTLRQFAGGAVVWGARTMAGFDNSGESDYAYVPVRRTALMIEESLYRGLQFAVFEPNDEPLWAQIRLAAGAFMQNLFRQGAFQGSKASEAYDVRCDSSTTTQNDINLGRVNVVVAFAPLRPAEFVVLTVRQLAGQVQV